MEDIPDAPGVYAWYRHSAAIYVGKATSLRDRVGKRHLGNGRRMTGSAFRRNVAEHLGISTPNEIYTRAYQPTAEELARVRSFIDGCEVTWITCASAKAAEYLETVMKKEWLPPLTKQ